MTFPNQDEQIDENTAILHDPYLNKGSAFTEEERDKLGLRGLLPPHVANMDEQTARVMKNLRAKDDDLEKYIFLVGLQERNKTLFYRVLIDHMEELMPIVYTPTVGKACQEYGHIFRRPQGLFVSLRDAGHVESIMNNWPEEDVRVIVVTDGQRILGLGDQGSNGMGIPVGKLSLYTACAGIHPRQCLPVAIDAGTNNEALLEDPLYLGLHRERDEGEAYDALVEEFVQSARKIYPNAVIQFEDFGTRNAFRFLEKYRYDYPVFNDDIQGTAAVTLAGVYSALRLTEGELSEQRILFLGAGEAGVGIAELIAQAMTEEGLDIETARKNLWLVDSKGLVVASRKEELAKHKLPFAHEGDSVKTLIEAIHMLKPNMIIGVSGQARTFTQEVVEAMTKYNKKPVIFALSNPTSHSECTAEQAYQWSKGKAIFASGSPFDPVMYNQRRYVPGQANNSYVFPGIGLGVVVSKANRVTDEMFMAAARTLADLATDRDLSQGRLFPALTQIRDISAHIAYAVCNVAEEQDLLPEALPDNLMETIKQVMYDPKYAE
jgi:malate dehydrogenase (oxaloacetate-decarboxylating)(NADP+)